MLCSTGPQWRACCKFFNCCEIKKSMLVFVSSILLLVVCYPSCKVWLCDVVLFAPAQRCDLCAAVQVGVLAEMLGMQVKFFDIIAKVAPTNGCPCMHC